jgi:hypothetical protein
LTTDKPVRMSSEIDRRLIQWTLTVFAGPGATAGRSPSTASPITLWNRGSTPQSCSGKHRRPVEKFAYAKCQVEDHHVRVKILVVIAMARVQGEVRSRIAPREVRRVNEHISAPCRPMAYRRWDGVIASLSEPDFNAGISRFRHDVVSTTIEVKWCAVGGATVGEGDTTPLVEVNKCVAVVAGGSPAASFFV